MHSPMRISYVIGSLLHYRSSLELRNRISPDFSDTQDPGGKIIAQLDKCTPCDGTGIDPLGFGFCRFCQGSGLCKITSLAR